jgi:hypothetical protein
MSLVPQQQHMHNQQLRLRNLQVLLVSGRAVVSVSPSQRQQHHFQLQQLAAPTPLLGPPCRLGYIQERVMGGPWWQPALQVPGCW